LPLTVTIVALLAGASIHERDANYEVLMAGFK
jgi:hypothetical protein